MLDQSRHGVDARTGIEFVRIAGGTHWMGSPPGLGNAGERPRHRVTLAPYELARTPVTNAQYQRYLEANPRVEPPEYWGDRHFNQPDQPVVGVSWHDAMAYCAWASSDTEKVTLPTEAQWEVACRAGSDAQYCNGDAEAELDAVGWHEKNSGGRLHAVAEKQPNAWGFYDMHGNVWEWCRDGVADDLEPYSTHARHPDGLRCEPDTDELRVVRGGCFDDAADLARSAFRFVFLAVRRHHLIGFRPARVIS
jgi:formylglycine-generating enzyme required for sulfatase activity